MWFSPQFLKSREHARKVEKKRQEELAKEIEQAEDNQDFQFWLNNLPEMPVAPLPYVALWWRI